MIDSTAIFATDDIVTTLRYYEDVLCFKSTWTWGEPPSFGGALHGAVTIMFSLQPELAAKVAGHQHYIGVEEVDELYELHRARGAKIVDEIANRPWGRREYVVEAPNGYRLRFAGLPTQEVTKSKPFPQEVQIVRRMPTADEFARIAGQEFYSDGVPTRVLEQTWGGVVAVSPSGDVIGTARIMYDAPGWFSVWDVAVVEEWQGQHIGEAIMKEALAAVRDESPGAFVYLFTFKHGFYEKLGFGKQTVSMRKV